MAYRTPSDPWKDLAFRIPDTRAIEAEKTRKVRRIRTAVLVGIIAFSSVIVFTPEEPQLAPDDAYTPPRPPFNPYRPIRWE